MKKRFSFLIFLPLLSMLLPAFAFSQAKLEGTLICGLPRRNEGAKGKSEVAKEIKNALLLCLAECFSIFILQEKMENNKSLTITKILSFYFI